MDRWLRALERAHLRGLDIGEDLAGHLRATQMRRLLAISPLLMTANILNGAIVGAALTLAGHGVAMAFWTPAVLLYGLLGLRSTNRRKRRPGPDTAPISTIRRLLINSIVLAALWGSLTFTVLLDPDELSIILVTAVVSGMLGGGAIALGFVPIAATVYTVTTLALCAVAITLMGSFEAFALAPLLGTYGYVLIRSASTYGRGFAQTVINERRLQEQAATIDILLKEYEHGGRDWIWESDAEGRVLRGIDEVADASGLSRDVIVEAIAARNARQLREGSVTTHGLGDLSILTGAKQIIRNHLVGIGTEDGGQHWFRMNGKPLYDEAGDFTGYRGVMSNVTEETKSEQRVRYLAHHDPMTGLVNRSSFQTHLEQAIEEKQDGFRSYAVMYLDLDGFKSVNDMFGHPTGDALLVEVAERLLQAAGRDDTVARLGGDEFAILTPFEDHMDEIAPFARRLIDALGQPYVAEGNTCSISVSIGIASVGDHGDTSAALLHAADMALYRAKQAGKRTFVAFDAQMDETFRDEIHFEEELRQAIARSEFSLQFQPFFSCHDGTLAGFEALVRWTHPTLGKVSPTRFIPVAEKIGIIGDLGNWVLNEACSVAAGWPEELSVAVNASMPQFRDGKIVSAVRNALDLSGLDGSRLEVEITEQVFADRPEEILQCMDEIKACGVSISLDDFGTGYSSLLYLLKFPFDKLKIDRSFVATALINESAHGVLETIASLGVKLGLETTAEGIETAEQMMLAQSVGCTFCQGFLLGRPMAVDDLAPFILKRFQDTAPPAASVSRSA